MTPDLLALDFDGVLCDGMSEYFETSRRTCARIWPGDATPDDGLFPAFRRLRPVIMTGWEMPLLLRALMAGRSESEILEDWPVIRDALVRSGPVQGDAVTEALKTALDDVRREWIAADRPSWLARNQSYCPLEDLRRVMREPQRTVLVTTKEGEFARLILDAWDLRLAGIEGKEAGTHKCENLRALIGGFRKIHGRAPTVWFVEDRLETLEHVTTHPDLDAVGLYLATWGYNTPSMRARAEGSARIRLLSLEQFRAGVTTWPSPGAQAAARSAP